MTLVSESSLTPHLTQYRSFWRRNFSKVTEVTAWSWQRRGKRTFYAKTVGDGADVTCGRVFHSRQLSCDRKSLVKIKGGCVRLNRNGKGQNAKKKRNKEISVPDKIPESATQSTTTLEAIQLKAAMDPTAQRSNGWSSNENTASL